MTFSNLKPMLMYSAIISLFASQIHADPLSQAIQTETATTSAAIKSQQKIDALSDKTKQMLEQYRSALHQSKSLATYNKHLQDLLASQQQEKDSLEQQLQDIETTQHDIVPLILRMMDSLEKFIQLDLPFLPEERSKRLAMLKDMITRADISNAEKYRRIIEAYQIENDYGKTIEAYRGDLTLNGVTSSVDFLRLGRIALYYQSLDGGETGYWDKEQKQWRPLSSDYRNAIRNGLRIARKEAAPDMLTLPIPAAEAGQ